MGHRFRGYEHEQLYKMINTGAGPDASHPQTVYWKGLSDELTQVDEDLNKALTDLKATWEGQASDNAQTGMTPLREWATDAEQGSTVMRISSEDQAEYVATARAEMPEPVRVTTPAPSGWDMAAAGAAALTGNPVPAVAVAAQAFDHERQEAAQNEAEQKAVDTMNTYQSSSIWNRATLGTFVAPPEVVVSTPAPQGGTSGGVVGGFTAGMAYSDSSGGSTTASGFTPPPSGSGVPAPPSGGGGGLPAPGSGGGGGVPTPPPTFPGGGPTSPSGGGPVVVTPTPPPSSPPPPSPPTPVPPGNPGGGGGPVIIPPGGQPTDGGGGKNTVKPGSGPGSSGPGTAKGVPGADGSRSQLGRGGVGGMGGIGGMDADGSRSGSQLGKGGAAGIGGQGGALGGRGGAGAGGPGARGGAGGPMGAGGRRADGEEDDEHFAPDYLMETADVFGDERLVSPPVIGENPQQ